MDGRCSDVENGSSPAPPTMPVETMPGEVVDNGCVYMWRSPTRRRTEEAVRDQTSLPARNRPG